MPGTPLRVSKHEGAVVLRQVVGKRVREIRELRGLEKKDLARRMDPEGLGHKSWSWTQTVTQVEAGNRNVSVDELVSLAVALQTTVAYLLSPVSLDPRVETPAVDVGAKSAPVDPDDLWLIYGFVPASDAAASRLVYDWNNDDEKAGRLGSDNLVRVDHELVGDVVASLPVGVVTSARFAAAAEAKGAPEWMVEFFRSPDFLQFFEGLPARRTESLTGRPIDPDEPDTYVELREGEDE